MTTDPSESADRRRSWAANPAPLNDILQPCHSYGFAFVGFSERVTGKFAMDEFVIKLAPR